MRGVGRPMLLCGCVAWAACQDGRLVVEEDLPASAKLKVVTWSDALTTTAVLRASIEPVDVPVAEALALGGIVHLSVLGFSRAELDRAVPGLVGVTDDVVLAQVEARVGGATAIPGSAPVLVADISDDTGPPLTYQAIPRADWDRRATEGGGATVGLAVPDALACRRVAPPDAVDLPDGFRPVGIAAMDADHAVLVGRTPTRDLALLVVTSTSTRLLPPATPPATRPHSDLGWDPVTRTVWFLDGATLSRVDLDGQHVEFPAPPQRYQFTLGTGIDGTVLALSAYTEAGGIATQIYDPRGAQWTTVEDFAGGPRLGPARAHHRARYMADLNCHTSPWEYDEQRNTWTWGAARLNGERASDSNCLLRQRALALDESQYLWLGYRGNLRRGVDDRPGLWPEMEHGLPLGADNDWPKALAAMGALRFAVGGLRGQLEVWIGDRWCVPAPVTPDVDLTLGAGADGVAWFAGAGTGGRARAVRVRVDVDGGR